MAVFVILKHISVVDILSISSEIALMLVPQLGPQWCEININIISGNILVPWGSKQVSYYLSRYGY